jgi:hypothetical protein
MFMSPTGPRPANDFARKSPADQIRADGFGFAVLCGAFLTVVLGSTVVFTATRSIVEDLSFSTDEVQWVCTASALATGGLLFLGGRLADLLGRRQMFMIGIMRPRVNYSCSDRGAQPPRCFHRGDGARRPVFGEHDVPHWAGAQ